MAFDPGDMLGAVRRLPDELEAALAASLAVAPQFDGPPASALVMGMGGSAIAGDLAVTLWGDELASPVVVWRGPELPAWVGPSTLVVVSSFSGDTRETRAAYGEAARRGAMRVVLSAGGALAESAVSDGVSQVPLAPGGQPRAALGRSLGALLAVLRGARLIGDPSASVRAASGAMRGVVAWDASAYHDGGAAATSREPRPAAQPDPAPPTPEAFARWVHGRLAVFAAPYSMSAVARRWKCQWNENAKVAAYWEELPEMNHNAVEGFGAPPDIATSGALVGLAHPSAGDHPSTGLDAAVAVAADAGWQCTIIRPPVSDRRTEALWLLMYGDLASVRLAGIAGVDPTPVASIQRVKAATGDSRLESP